METLVTWLNKEIYHVEVINEENSAANNENNSNVNNNKVTPPSLPTTVARGLFTLLASNLSSQPFHFISHVMLDEEKQSVSNENETSPLKQQKVRRSRVSASVPLSEVSQNSVDVPQSPDSPSIIGSPLKLDQIADLDSDCADVSVFHSGGKSAVLGLSVAQQVPLQDARQMLQKFILEYRSRRNTDPEVSSMLAVLCNGADARKTLLTGILAEKEHSIAEMTSFTLTFDTVSLLSKEVQQAKGDAYRMTALYELLDPTLGLGSINLTASWKDSKGRLKLTSPLSTEFTVEWKIEIGHELSPVYFLYKELQRVSEIVHALRSENVPEVDAQSLGDIPSKLTDLFTHYKAGQRSSDDVKNREGEFRANRLNLCPDVDKDFPDDLWTVLISCSDLSTLVACLKHTFNELSHGQLSPYVRADNLSMLANLVRAAASGIAVFPPLTSTLALRLVAEIGAAKLQKTYHEILVTANDLWNDRQWKEVFNSASGKEYTKSEDFSSLALQLSALVKVHSCLECVAVVDACTDSLDLSKIACTSLQHYMGIDISCNNNASPTCKLPVSAAMALPETRKHVWVSMRREGVDKSRAGLVETFLHHMPQGLIDSSPCEGDMVYRFVARHNSLLPVV